MSSLAADCFLVTVDVRKDTRDETQPTIKGFNYSEETIWNNFRNLVSLKFTYYFYKGKSRSHAGKRISNSDNDSGLTQSNTAN